MQEMKVEQVLQEICSLSPETVKQLNLDSEDRVCAQLSGISHRGFLVDLDRERGTRGERTWGLGNSQAFMNLGKAEVSLLDFLSPFLDLPGSHLLTPSFYYQ